MVENAGWNYVAGKIEKDEEESIDGEAEVRYNRTKKKTYLSFNRVGYDTVLYLKSELKKIYNGRNGIANEIAIIKDDEIYIVDSGFENGHVQIGIISKTTISDSDIRKQIARRFNDDAVANGYVSDGLSESIKSRYGDDSDRGRRRKSRAKLQTDSRESEDNQGGVLGENADDGGVKFSLKQGQINALKVRGVVGDALLDAIDLSDEILAVNGEITDDAKVVLYHATSEDIEIAQ